MHDDGLRGDRLASDGTHLTLFVCLFIVLLSPHLLVLIALFRCKHKMQECMPQLCCWTSGWLSRTRRATRSHPRALNSCAPHNTTLRHVFFCCYLSSFFPNRVCVSVGCTAGSQAHRHRHRRVSVIRPLSLSRWACTGTHRTPSIRLTNAYAEVWGTDSQQQLVPVAWIGGMTDVTGSDTQTLPLHLDHTWLQRAGASAPFVLRNVYVQDRYTHVPHAQVSEIKVQSDASYVAFCLFCLFSAQYFYVILACFCLSVCL